MRDIDRPIEFNVVQLGELNRPEAANALSIANQIQRAYRFHLLDTVAPFDKSRFSLSGKTFDLDAALQEWRQQTGTPLPLIGISGLPYGDPQAPGDRRYFMNMNKVQGGDDKLSLISTELWSSLPGRRPLQPYLLYTLAGVVMSYTVDVHVHNETRDCVMGSVEAPEAIDRCVQAASFCADCERIINLALRKHGINNHQVSAVQKLLNRAVGAQVAFLATPFDATFKNVSAQVERTLKGLGWTVTRADRVRQPRRVTDAIIQGILSADLVVADITGNNANVFYELGFAHASGTDVLLLTQDRRIPFDVTVERAVKYSASARGLAKLGAALGEMVPPKPS